MLQCSKEGAITNMQTKRWNVKSSYHGIAEAANLLKKGLTVAFPTETVYGLGADATNEQAVSAIFTAKGRPQDNPLIVHVSGKAQLSTHVSDLPKYAEKLIDTFTPGPITFVLPSNGTCAKNVSAGLSTIAVRIPDHPVARQLLERCNLPIAAPSANLSGKSSTTAAENVWADLFGKIAGLVDGGSTGICFDYIVIYCIYDITIKL